LKKKEKPFYGTFTSGNQHELLKMLRFALFWDIAQHRVLIQYRRFGNKSKKSSWTYWPLKMGPIGCPETSVGNYHSTLY